MYGFAIRLLLITSIFHRGISYKNQPQWVTDYNAELQNNPKIGPLYCPTGKMVHIFTNLTCSANTLFIANIPEYYGGFYSFDFFQNTTWRIELFMSESKFSAPLAEFDGWWDPPHRIRPDWSEEVYHINVYIGCFDESFSIYILERNIGPAITMKHFNVAYPTPPPYFDYGIWVMGGPHPDLSVEYKDGPRQAVATPHFQQINKEISLYVPHGYVEVFIYVPQKKGSFVDLDFYSGDDILITLSIRFHISQAVLNSKRNGNWGVEAVFKWGNKELLFYPYVYIAEFLFTRRAIWVEISGVALPYFDYPVGFQKKIDYLKITWPTDTDEPLDILAIHQRWDTSPGSNRRRKTFGKKNKVSKNKKYKMKKRSKNKNRKNKKKNRNISKQIKQNKKKKNKNKEKRRRMSKKNGSKNNKKKKKRMKNNKKKKINKKMKMNKKRGIGKARRRIKKPNRKKYKSKKYKIRK